MVEKYFKPVQIIIKFRFSNRIQIISYTYSLCEYLVSPLVQAFDWKYVAISILTEVILHDG